MYRLVVVDDEYIVVRGIEAIIKREDLDCEVVGAAYNGIEALELLKETKPDVVITDIRIPKLDGLSLIEEAKEFLPETYFIVISGFKEFEYAKRALSMGVVSYIEKPVTIEEIKKAMAWIEKEELKKKAFTMALNSDLRRSELNMYIDEMFDVILQNDSEKLREKFDKYIETLHLYFPEFGRFKRECLQIVCLLSEFYAEKEKANKWVSGISCNDLLDMETFEEVIEYVNIIINKIIGSMETNNYDISNKDIMLVLEYIGSHYNEDIGLNELAEIVDLSPAYLSVLFKKEVGISFVKYLTNLRIKKAKEYLSQSYKVFQVSELVGYNNYRHFSDTFKRYVGLSPNEYKESI